MALSAKPSPSESTCTCKRLLCVLWQGDRLFHIQDPYVDAQSIPLWTALDRHLHGPVRFLILQSQDPNSPEGEGVADVPCTPACGWPVM